MNKKLVFWIISTLLFGDLLYGGVIFLLSGDYWEYQPILINAIEAAAFTYGFSLLTLVPYGVGVVALSRMIKLLEPKYKKILLVILVTIIGLYAGGLVHHTQKTNKSRNMQEQFLATQRLVQSEFAKDVGVSDFVIHAIPNNYKMYEIKFSLTVPAKYIGDSEGTAEIELKSEYDTDIVEESFGYSQSKVTEANTQRANDYSSDVQPYFDMNGDLVIDISYVINEINNPNFTRHKIYADLKIDPGYRRTDPQYYNLEYKNSFVAE